VPVSFPSGLRACSGRTAPARKLPKVSRSKWRGIRLCVRADECCQSPKEAYLADMASLRKSTSSNRLERMKAWSADSPSSVKMHKFCPYLVSSRLDRVVTCPILITWRQGEPFFSNSELISDVRGRESHTCSNP
jgi:hypothetical protein